MAVLIVNDIIGAPEIVVIKGRVFWFSPLNDFENACLESWLKWRRGIKTSLASDEAFEELDSNPGALQLLFQSIRRTEPSETINSLIEFIDEDTAACGEVYSAWLRINYSGGTDVTATDSKPATEFDISDIYTFLGKHYKWASPEVVSRMTRTQQLAYLEAIGGKNDGSLFFETADDYMQWKLENGK